MPGGAGGWAASTATGSNCGIEGAEVLGGIKSVGRVLMDVTEGAGVQVKVRAFATAGTRVTARVLKGAISQDFIVNYPFEC
jgi:hypothetical protein